jgi:hypothetical protein
MGKDVKERKPDSPSPQSGGSNSNRCGRRCIYCPQCNNATNVLPGLFKDKTQDIENNIIDNTGPHNAENFHCFLKHIADHLQLIHGNKVLEGIQTMTPITINIPMVPTPQPDPNTIANSFQSGN